MLLIGALIINGRFYNKFTHNGDSLSNNIQTNSGFDSCLIKKVQWIFVLSLPKGNGCESLPAKQHWIINRHISQSNNGRNEMLGLFSHPEKLTICTKQH